MKDLCIHSVDVEEAYDISEIFYHHSKVKEDPQIMFKVQTYNLPGGKKSRRRSYLTTIKMEN